MASKQLSIDERSAYRRLEDVVGCNWPAAAVGTLQRGATRPGQLERYIPGISTKVLTERLRKLLNYGLITREDRSGTVMHVEYNLTPTGWKPARIFEQVHELQERHRVPEPVKEGTTQKAARSRATRVSSSGKERAS
jgi:Predicted transcriptional regulators